MDIIEINGKHLYRDLLEQAIYFSTRVADGKIEKEEVDTLLNLSDYSQSMSDACLNTLQHIREFYYFTEEASDHFDAFLENIGASKSA